MAGPVDCRINPTGVNVLANSKPIEWFEKNLISHVPWPHKGMMRRVYPGFLQLTAFLSMNMERHKKSFADLYRHARDGEFDKARSSARFMTNTSPSMTCPQRFTCRRFQRCSRPMTCRGMN